VLVAPLLDVHNIGVVHQAGRAVGRVGSPVQILCSIHDWLTADPWVDLIAVAQQRVPQRCLGTYLPVGRRSNQ
jgi:hypothetical protein